MRLIIVESPTKAKTISQFLGKDYKVLSSFGHVRDLPKGNLGIDVDNNFEPKYVIPTKSRKTVTALKKEAAKSETVILATDEDREGEGIAWHLTEALGLGISNFSAKGGSASGGQFPISKKNPKSKSQTPKKVERIVFHEITKRAIEEALKNPREIDEHLVNAQQGRRVLDRLVGYQLSPFLWKKIARGLSAGRVQSVALRLIVDRENEIRNFKAQEYWSISAILQKLKFPISNSPARLRMDEVQAGGQFPITVDADLVKIGNKTLDKFAIPNKDEAEKLVDDLKKCAFSVLKIDKKEVRKNPPTPFTTSTLQQDAARRLGYTAKKTMFLAQRLYEHGRITYMRTDSMNLSAESVSEARAWLTQNLGEKYALPSPRIFTSKSKLAQEAHEAIRPTDPSAMPENISFQEPAEKKLYDLIWRRFMASQMPEARISNTNIEILANPKSEIRNPKQYGLRASGQQMIFDGYLKIWKQKFEEKELPELSENEELDLKELKPEQHFTEPPPRYSEATLVKTLEEYGIGRPSTYAPTISVIQVRNYVIKEERKFKPTEIGELVNKVLVENFPEVVDIGFTAQMEDELDEIANGKIDWRTVISEFYGPFSKNLEKKYAEVSKAEVTGEEKTNEVCEKCGKAMIIKMGRFGKFLACSGFPECKNAKSLNRSEKSELNPNDPNQSRAIGMKCPKCSGGEVVERRVHRGRARGKIFWGCSRYPDCDYASWKNPTEKPSS